MARGTNGAAGAAGGLSAAEAEALRAAAAAAEQRHQQAQQAQQGDGMDWCQYLAADELEELLAIDPGACYCVVWLCTVQMAAPGAGLLSRVAQLLKVATKCVALICTLANLLQASASTPSRRHACRHAAG